MTEATPSPDYLALGHVSADLQPDGSIRLGGTVSYAGMTASRLGWSAGLVSRAAPGMVDAAMLPGLRCIVGHSEDTTTFTNRYDAEGRRVQRLHALAAPIEASDCPPAWRHPRILHLAPIAGELGVDILETLGAELIGLTPQGWLRHLELGAPVRPCALQVPLRGLRRANAVVLSEEDVAGLEGGVERLAAEIVSRTCVLVLTRGASGARAYTADGVLTQAAFSVPSIDPTGAGDVFAASFFIRLWETKNLEDALRFAAAAAALSITREGLLGIPDRVAVEQLAEAGPGQLAR